ncbi:MAG: putative phage tail protein [Planctomycetota bacterium]
MVVDEKLRERYADQSAALLPPGAAWTRAKGTVMRKLLEGLAALPAQVHARGADLVDEADAGSTTELLEDWERVLDLPKPCGELEPTAEFRRNAVLAKLTGVGGQTPSFFVEFAASLGYPITIEEPKPARVGVSHIGDLLWGSDFAHGWIVHAPEYLPRFFRAGEGQAGEPIVAHGNELLECYLDAASPAHSTVAYVYDQSWDGYAPYTEHHPEPTAITVGVPNVIRKEET